MAYGKTTMHNVHRRRTPLGSHKLTLMREQEPLATREFRALASEVGMPAWDTRPCATCRWKRVTIETPIADHARPQGSPARNRFLRRSSRAGIGFLDGLLALLPTAVSRNIGLYRDPDFLEPVEYYFKAPDGLDQRLVLVLDPMLATRRDGGGGD